MRAEGRPSHGRARAALVLASAAATLAAIALVWPWLWPAPGEPADLAAQDAAAPAPTPPREIGSETSVAAQPPAAQAPSRVPSGAPTGEPGPEDATLDDVEIFPPRDQPPPPDPAEEAAAPYFPQPVPYEGPTGIELFPPMGTKKVRAGIIVPDDFPLPEGFVRHHQLSDDGEPLPPILMVHPDYQILDENGAPVADRNNPVVPPEYAPEGLPIRMLELPETGQ
jgi:hypothetical protein